MLRKLFLYRISATVTPIWIATFALSLLSASPSHASDWRQIGIDGSGERAFDALSLRKVGSSSVTYSFRFTNGTTSRSAQINVDCVRSLRQEQGDQLSEISRESPYWREVQMVCAFAKAEPNASIPIPSLKNPAMQDDEREARKNLYPTPKSSGSGFLVNAYGNVVTNYHVIDGCNTLTAAINGKITGAKVVASNENFDLAVLRLDSQPSGIPLPISNAAGVVGQSVMTIGYPFASLLGVEPRVTTGIVSSLSGIAGDRTYIQTSTAIQPGNSGGPLLDDNGAVVGLVNARLAARFRAENVNFAIKASLLRSFLDMNGISYITPLTTRKVGTALTQLVERVTPSTTLVTCY